MAQLPIHIFRISRFCKENTSLPTFCLIRRLLHHSNRFTHLVHVISFISDERTASASLNFWACIEHVLHEQRGALFPHKGSHIILKLILNFVLDAVLRLNGSGFDLPSFYELRV